MKAITLLLLLAFINAKTIKNLKDAPITFSIVEENTAKWSRYKATPPSIIPGGKVDFKAQFEATAKVHIKELFLDTLNNGVSLFQDHIAIDKDYEIGGKDVVTYSAAIPSFCPPGSWDIMLTLLDDSGNNVAVLKAHFDIE